MKFKRIRLLLVIFFTVIFFVGGILFFLPENGLYGRKASIKNDLKVNVNSFIKNDQDSLNVALSVQKALRNVARSVNPTVVNISIEKIVRRNTRQNDFFDLFDLLPYRPKGPQTLRSLGSGFIISKDGFIVTNNHVVQDADKIKILLFNEKEYEGKIVGRDSLTDIAVIKIVTKEKVNFKTTPLGNSDSVEIGDFAIAIGNPFGLRGTFTLGIVSAVGRDTLGKDGGFQDYIQTDASINRGNSGGPLINIYGQAIGINTVIYSDNGGGSVGIGFAIPMNIVRKVVTSLIDNGFVERGFLGVNIGPIPEDVASHLKISKKAGIFISNVFENSPASRAGIQDGDIIVSFDGKTITSSSELQRYVSFLPVGKSVIVKVLRNKRKISLKVTIAKRDSDSLVVANDNKVKSSKDYFFGAFVDDINKYYRHFRLDKNKKGVVVIKIEPNSPAQKAGIVLGDVIQSINYQPILSIKDFRTYNQRVKKKEALIKLNRGNRNYFLLLRSSK